MGLQKISFQNFNLEIQTRNFFHDKTRQKHNYFTAKTENCQSRNRRYLRPEIFTRENTSKNTKLHDKNKIDLVQKFRPETFTVNFLKKSLFYKRIKDFVILSNKCFI